MASPKRQTMAKHKRENLKRLQHRVRQQEAGQRKRKLATPTLTFKMVQG
jgi:hypothetical protein